MINIIDCLTRNYTKEMKQNFENLGKGKKRQCYFVEYDTYGQHGSNIDYVMLTKKQLDYYENKFENNSGFLTDNLMSAYYYVND